MSSVPALVISAPNSGSGKTTIATGMIGALRRAGHRVAAFKTGPDYIDPGYHALAAGRVGRNLDPVLVGEDLIGPLFRHGSAGADIAVVEGAMGLFDGRISDREPGPQVAVGSTAHVAQLLSAPVVMVVDGSGHGQSLAATLHGFLTYEPAIGIVGVILNRVGSERHEYVLRQACASVGLAVLGVVRRDASLSVPSRHLGLVPAAEQHSAARAAVARMTDVAGAALDIPALVSAASSHVSACAWSPQASAEPVSARVAIAGGRAFTFGYAEHAEMLAGAGAEVFTVDPLRDRLPEDLDALVIGGGFPEEHAEELAANTGLAADIRAHVDRGGLVHAECAGLLYLARELDGHPMSGVLPIRGRFTSHLTLGYRDAVAVSESAVYPVGTTVTGHEFHRSRVEFDRSSALSPAWGWRQRDRQTFASHAASTAHSVRDGIVYRGVHASYLHVHSAAAPEAVRAFVHAAARGKAPSVPRPKRLNPKRLNTDGSHPEE